MTIARVNHIGGPTTLIEIGEWRFLTDPTFDPPGRDYHFGLGTGSRKLCGPALPPDRIGRIDAVLLSHDHHPDNLDDAGRALLPSAGVVLTTAAGAGRLGANARGLEPWATTRLDHATHSNDRYRERDGGVGDHSIEVTATPCRHGFPGSRLLVGDVIGFALQWTGTTHGALWITGDTVLYPGVRRVPERLRIGTILLHLGGVRFGITGPARYTMIAREAIELCRLVRPRTVIPIHYEGWGHFHEGRDAIEREFARAPIDIREAIRWLPIGEAVEIEV